MDRQAAFARMSRLLAQSFHVVTYDRRGYGKSSHQRGPFSVEEQINDLTDVIQQTTQGEPLILIGHSFGESYHWHLRNNFQSRWLDSLFMKAP